MGDTVLKETEKYIEQDRSNRTPSPGLDRSHISSKAHRQLITDGTDEVAFADQLEIICTEDHGMTLPSKDVVLLLSCSCCAAMLPRVTRC